MSNFIKIFAFGVFFGGTLVSCNSESQGLPYEPPTSALVKGFSLSADSKVIDNLDKVFFSIDLANCSIFNADSMPYGTNTEKLVPVITTGGVSALELIVPRPGKEDTTYNYLTNSTDSIDFSNGPVKLRLKSIDELLTLEYTVSVNVHKVKSDSLAWGDMAYSQLPTNLDNVVAQHTLKHKGEAYCLTSNGTTYCLATCTNPAANAWAMRTVAFGFVPQVNTFRASSEALYILADDGTLHTSTDLGNTWEATNQKFDWLIGGYAGCVVGTFNDNGQWRIQTSNGLYAPAPEAFPVTGTSVPVEYTFPMSASRMITVVGGRQANGQLTSAAWGFDGTSWARLSAVDMAAGLEGMTLTPYFVFEENEYWVATKESVFIAFGGRDAQGQLNHTTYISYNYGMTWRKAEDLMQLPMDVPTVDGGQTLVFSSLLGSRASMAITSWECPYIYLYGGNYLNGTLNREVWRGVVNRLQFKPLQ